MTTEPASQGTPRRHRLLYLDVIRAAAIVLVLFSHAPVRLQPGEVGRWVFSGLSRIGWQGVDLFFVLSGFLIGGLLFDELRRYGSIKVGRFWLRRAWKIWPMYVVFLLSVAVYFFISIEGSTEQRLSKLWNGLWPYVFQVQNYVPRDHVMPFNIGHTWSLAVEEHFYLALPLILLFLIRRDVRNLAAGIPILAGGLLLFCLGWRIFVFDWVGKLDMVWIYAATHSRMDTLFLGVLLAYAVRYHPDVVDRLRPLHWWMLAFAVASFLPAISRDKPPILRGTLVFTVTALGSACFVLLAWWRDHDQVHPAPAFIKGLAFVGAWSYATYLFHVPFARNFIAWAHQWMPWAGTRIDFLCTITVYIIVSTAIGGLLTITLERPVLKLRDALHPSRSAIR